VIINLVTNAIEAMRPVTDRPRELVIIRNSLERFREGILGGCLSEYARQS
jgi:hypothetical protein